MSSNSFKDSQESSQNQTSRRQGARRSTKANATDIASKTDVPIKTIEFQPVSVEKDEDFVETSNADSGIDVVAEEADLADGADAIAEEADLSDGADAIAEEEAFGEYDSRGTDDAVDDGGLSYPASADLRQGEDGQLLEEDELVGEDAPELSVIGAASTEADLGIDQNNASKASGATASSEQDADPRGKASDSSKSQGRSKGQHGAHAKKAQSTFMQRSSRMRKVLIAVIVVLVIILAAAIFFGVGMVHSGENAATQQTQIVDTDVTQADEGDDTSEGQARITTVPDLVALLGHTRSEAVKMLAHGAEVVSSRKVKEEDNPVKREVQIQLTEEPADSQSGTPTVYLSLNGKGKIIQAGYSGSTSSLGYGSVSFADAVENQSIIENTLGEAGLTVEKGAAVLPEDKTKYSEYSSDGTTLTKEYCTFEGVGMANGKEHEWEAILSYDYTVANATDNLSDTIRTIYIYIE